MILNEFWGTGMTMNNDSMYDVLTERLPPEIVSYIYMYVQSPTAVLIRNSKYFHSSFPFLFLRKLSYAHHRRFPLPPSYANCLAYYQYDVYWTIVQWQHPIVRGRYRLNFVHTSEHSIVPQDPFHHYSENIGLDLEYYYTMYMNTVYYQLMTDHASGFDWRRFFYIAQDLRPVVTLCCMMFLAMGVILTLFIAHG